MVIDAHAHVYEYLRPYGPRGEGRALGGGLLRWPDGKTERFFPARFGDRGFTAETLLALMHENAVDKAVLLQAPNYGFQNEYIAAIVQKYPDRFIGACAFDPYAKRASELFRHFTDDFGCRIVKFEISETWGLSGIHPDLSLDSPLFDPVWDWAQQRNVTVVIDTGPRGDINWRTDTIAEVLQRHPELRMVVAHSLFPCSDGFNDTRLSMLSAIAGENCYFDISNLIPGVGTYPYPELQNYLRRLVDLAGADHVMWGSDLPSSLCRYDYRESYRYLIEGEAFSATELSWILGGTAEKLYFKQNGMCPTQQNDGITFTAARSSKKC